MNTWTYTHPYDPMLLTMHDCTVTKIDLEESEEETRMTWHLPDGIWITPEIPCHEIEKMCRTAEARIVFSNKDVFDDYKNDLSVSVCMKSRWHGKDKRMLTETWEYMTLPAFITQMKENGWSFEIVNTYTEGSMFLITGDIHTPKEFHRCEFRISFIADSANYFWNSIHPDRVW